MTLLIDIPSPGLRLLTINRPSRRNALDRATYLALAEALLKAAEDQTVRAVVLTGAEGCFTAGNDIADFATAPAKDEPGDGIGPAMTFLRALIASTKPVIAAIEGHAVGIGTTLLLHCDLAYAGATARFALPFTKLGLSPEGASSLLLPRLAGDKLAAELLLLGEPFDAPTAVRAGLVNQVVPAGEALAMALETGKRLAALPAESIITTKTLLRRTESGAVEERLMLESAHFAELRQGPAAQAAFARFLAPRQGA